jgi:quinol monooxygenase YgiN
MVAPLLGRGAALVAAAKEVASATRADDGCVSYGFYADLEDGDRNLEIWADRESLDVHMTHDHTRAFLRVAPGLVAGQPTMSFYAVCQ